MKIRLKYFKNPIFSFYNRDVDEICTNCSSEGEPNEMIYCNGCPARCHYECAKPPPKSARTKKWTCQKCINAEKRSERASKRRRMVEG